MILRKSMAQSKQSPTRMYDLTRRRRHVIGCSRWQWLHCANVLHNKWITCLLQLIRHSAVHCYTAGRTLFRWHGRATWRDVSMTPTTNWWRSRVNKNWRKSGAGCSCVYAEFGRSLPVGHVLRQVCHLAAKANIVVDLVQLGLEAASLTTIRWRI